MPYSRSIDIDSFLDLEINNFIKKKNIMKKIFNNLKRTIISINKKKNFSLHSPLINKEDLKHLQKTILSTNVSSASNFTIDFEKKFQNLQVLNMLLQLIAAQVRC